MSCFRKKSIDGIFSVSSLKKELSVVDLIILGLGCMVGVGIFLVVGRGADQAGAGVSLSFVLAAVASLLAALPLAEFSTLVPAAGSVYTYAYVTLGEIFAWLIGWLLLFVMLLAASSNATGFSLFMQTWLGVKLPVFLGATYDLGGLINLPAMLLVLLGTLLLSFGVRNFKKVNKVMVLVKLLVILLFIGVGAFFVQPTYWQPFLPKTGMIGVVSGASIVFFAFLGFDVLAAAAEETKDPQRSLPRGLLTSIFITTLLYVAVALVMTGLLTPAMLSENQAAPIAAAIRVMTGQAWVGRIVIPGAVLGMSASVLMILYAIARILFAIARDGLLPKVFARVKAGTPLAATWIVGIAAALLAGLFPLEWATDVVGLGYLLILTVVSVSVIVLRYTRSDLKSVFRCPAVPWLPGISIMLNLYLMSTLSAAAWKALSVWLVLGGLVYYSYSYRHSSMMDNK